MTWAFVVGLAVGAIAALSAVPLLGRLGPAGRFVRAGRGAGRPPAAPVPEPRRPRGVGRRTIDALRVGVVVLDPEDHPVLANPASREMGLVRADGSGGDQALGVVPHPVVRSLAGRARRSEVPQDVELDLPRGGTGDLLGVRLRAVAVDERYVAVEAFDVTEAHRVARVRRDFVANVSHELKTPIGALLLLAEALMEATGPEAPMDRQAARRFAERIQHESARMGRLISELIELSRLQGAEPLPRPVSVPVDQVIAEVLDRNRTAAAVKGIRLRCAGERGLTVYGDATQLATAVGNLVENAVAYSPDTTDPAEPVEVVVDTRSGDDHIEIAVADRGIGIALGDLDRIFERFYRADKARSRATGGTGLGLAIVKHIATNHRGTVSVVSQPGSGSTFTLRLPAGRPDDMRGAPLGGDRPAGALSVERS